MSNIAPDPGLYVGSTTHARSDGRSRFKYNIFSVLIDVDSPEAVAVGALFAINRPGFLSFFAKDHGDRSGATLRPWAEQTLACAGVKLDGGPIRLLAMPRLFGFVFNPISIFFGYGPDQKLRGVIYEVNNTFGETHCYVAPVGGEEIHTQRADKEFHVSPFFDVSGTYEFRLQPPGGGFSLKVTKAKNSIPDHVASWSATRRPLTAAQLIRAWLASPLLTFWVVASIHWQALRVWLRGAKYYPKPPAPKSMITIGTAIES
ncbi:MAG: DUF1365 domain-containing protein [Caulobacterales bacterium]